MTRKTYEERLQVCKNPLLRKLFKIIIEKKSNLCIAVNFQNVEDALRLVDKVGKYICILKTQCLRFKGDPEENLRLLYEKKKQYNFLLFEDMKFCDTEETVKSVYAAKYVKYADLVTVMPLCGDEIFRAIETAVKMAGLPDDEPRGCLAVCEVSCAGWEPMDSAKLLTRSMSQAICAGVIAQKLQLPEGCDFIKASPGVHICKSGDGYSNQQWQHPNKVVGAGADVVIVGRGIVAEPESDHEEVARLYQEVSYQAYLQCQNQ